MSDRRRKYPPPQRARVLDIISEYAAKGYVDYITLGSSLLFSGAWVKSLQELSAETMYNNVIMRDYDATGYLDGLEVVHEDYKELFARFRDDKNVLFLFDPPYLATNVSSYENCWSLSDYLDVLKLLTGVKYVYFTSNKSQIVELCEWIKKNVSIGNPFEGSERRTKWNNLNYSTSFTDIMLVKG